MNKYIFFYYLALISCVAMVAVCFMPWVHYNSINETFTGYHVKRFATGNYYGRAGIIITVFAAVIFMLNIIPKNTAKRINLFTCAVLVAYSIRTYTIFTSALFEGEVTKFAGIYLIVILSFVLLICSAFPKMNENKNVNSDNETDIQK